MRFDKVDAFVEAVSGATCEAELRAVLEAITSEMGFAFFALTHHVNIPEAPSPAIRLHNYPDGWQEYFDSRSLGPSDPVHRASHLTSVGFAWSDLPQMIDLSRRDLEVLDEAGRRGIGNGFTIPAHVPGEANGSCSFAARRGAALHVEGLPTAQLVGAFAFEGARQIWRMRSGSVRPRPSLTDRQRDCLLWAAKGKTDWEIARILGLSRETVIQHLKLARERYGVTSRTALAVAALFDGSLAFAEILRR